MVDLQQLSPQQLIQHARAAQNQTAAYDAYDELLERDNVPWTNADKRDALFGMHSLNNAYNPFHAYYQNRALDHKFTAVSWCHSALQPIVIMQNTLASSDPSVKSWLNSKFFGLIINLREEVEIARGIVERFPN